MKAIPNPNVQATSRSVPAQHRVPHVLPKQGSSGQALVARVVLEYFFDMPPRASKHLAMVLNGHRYRWYRETGKTHISRPAAYTSDGSSNRRLHVCRLCHIIKQRKVYSLSLSPSLQLNKGWDMDAITPNHPPHVCHEKNEFHFMPRPHFYNRALIHAGTFPEGFLFKGTVFFGEDCCMEATLRCRVWPRGLTDSHTSL